MSKLKFSVADAKTSQLVVNLANAEALASNLPRGLSTKVVTEAWQEIADELDRRLPVLKSRWQP